MESGNIVVIGPGSAVTIGESINGTVLDVLIGQQNTIQYKVTWWNGNERKEAWMHQCEVKLSEIKDYLTIGLRS